MTIRIETVAITGSTSADLLARLGSGEHVAEGYWLVADRQSAGRGRQGRSWIDAAGNFMGSTVVNSAPGDPSPASLSFVAGLAVYEAIPGRRRAGVQLKWPNDVLSHGAKLAGILLERTGVSTVIGIGVNLVSAPAPDRRAAAYLGAIGAAPDRDSFAQDLAVSFDRELDRWRQFGTSPLFARWLAAAHPVGTALSVHDEDGASVPGVFEGLEPDGALRLRLADGALRVIHAGDVYLQGN